MALIESKEVIRTRILKQVARIWNIKESDLDVNRFDPLISFLAGACAKEFQHISHEIHASSTRVLEHLVKVLTPEASTGALPTHTIVHARSIEAEATVPQKNPFYCSWELADISKDVYFSPIGSPRIIDGDVKFVATGQNIFELNELGQKAHFAESEAGGKLDRSCYWVGLEISPKLDSLRNISFFFNWTLEYEHENYYYLLPHTKWTIGETELIVEQGHYVQEEKSFFLNRELKTNRHIERNIINEYNRQFVTLKSTIDLKKERKTHKQLPFPASFKKVFSLKDLKKIPQNLIWIKIQFPEFLPDHAIETINCRINCFPVFNRQLIQKYFNLLPNLNIQPLLTDDFFYEFDTLYTDEGKQFKFTDSVDLKDLHEGTFSLRNGGVQRFDQRRAHEMITVLMDMLRDESAAFTSLGLDIFSSDIKTLNQTINRIENKKLKNKLQKENINYLLIKTRSAVDTVNAEYWTTCGQFANNIPSGTKLIQGRKLIAHRNSIVLVSSSKGGRNQLQPDSAVKEYRKVLLTRNKIVTKEDVKAFCYAKLDEKITAVKVQRGVKLDPQPGQGMIRTIQVQLSIDKTFQNEGDWKAICDELRRELDKQSTGILPFEVSIMNEEV